MISSYNQSQIGGSLKKLKVLVLCGGTSAERDVSVVSARLVVESLVRSGHDVRLVLIDKKGRWLKTDAKLLTGRIGQDARALAAAAATLPAASILDASRAGTDVVFPILHGPMGEDGTMQGLLETSGFPYAGCGVLSSALCMDKDASKRVIAQAGLPQLPYAVIARPEQARAAARKLGFPLFVKPARLGSSVGVSRVPNLRALPRAIDEAFAYDDKVILEKGIAAREIECAILGDPRSKDSGDPLRLQASVCGEILPHAEFYSYEAKYLDPDGAELRIPAALPAAAAKKIRDMALRAFAALDCYGMARADFLLDRKTGRAYFNEINTIPGFTPISMYPMLWKASGLETAELVDRLLRLALRRSAHRSRLKTAP